MLRLCYCGWAQVLTLARRQVQQVEEAQARGKDMLMGSILVFLPGLRQIRDSHDLLMTGRGHFRGSDMTLEEARPRPHPRPRLQYRTFRTVLFRACPLELLRVPYPGFVLVSVSAVRTAPWLKRFVLLRLCRRRRRRRSCTRSCCTPRSRAATRTRSSSARRRAS